MRSTMIEPTSPQAVNETMSPPSDELQTNLPISQYAHKHGIEQARHHLVSAFIEGWLALILLSIAVYCVIFAIISVNWVNHTFILLWSTAAGLLIGVLAAHVRQISHTVLHITACFVGFWLAVWLTSVMAFHISWKVLLDNLFSLAISSWPIIMTSTNEIIFLCFLTFLCFLLGYVGTWLVYRRRQAVYVAFMYCSVLLANLNYAKQDISWVVVIFLAALVLLVARVHLTKQITWWTRMGLCTDQVWSRKIARRCMYVATILTLLTLLLAWRIPAQSQPERGQAFWTQLDKGWTNITHGQLSLQNPGLPIERSSSHTNFFGDQLTISGSVTPPTGEVLNYTSSAGPRFLEGFTYSHFDGHTWTPTASVANQSYPANTSLPPDVTTASSSQVTTSINAVQPPLSAKNYIFGPAQPTHIDVPTTVYGDGMTTAWSQQSPLTQGEHYQVVSLVPTVSEQDLASVPLLQTNPNQWSFDPNYGTLQSYYLQIPSDLSSATRNTVRQWTQGATNTYDALKMLTVRLSDTKQFHYTLHSPNIPDTVDAVDWLLHTHQGYCTHYATALTIMARLMGIPTRVVNGFTQGHFDAQRHVWVVNGNDAHSWVQAYFPGYGWIDFDPTPSFSSQSAASPSSPLAFVPNPDAHQPGSPTTKTTTTTTTTSPSPSSTVSPGSGTGTKLGLQIGQGASSHRTKTAAHHSNTSTSLFQTLLHFSLPLTTGFLILVLLAFGAYRWRKRSRTNTVASGMFWRLCWVASWAGLSPQTWQTPYEYSDVLSRHFPQEAALLWRLTRVFVHDRWAPPQETPHTLEEDDLIRLWPSLLKMFLSLVLLKIKNTKLMQLLRRERKVSLPRA